MGIAQKLKNSLREAHETLNTVINYTAKKAAEHPIVTKAIMIAGPTIAMGYLTLEHCVGHASAVASAPITNGDVTLKGNIISEHYDVGPDGIKGNSDDIYSIKLQTNTGTKDTIDVKFLGSQFEPYALKNYDELYGPNPQISDVIVNAQCVNGQYIGKDIYFSTNPNMPHWSEQDRALCMTSAFILGIAGFSTFLAIAGRGCRGGASDSNSEDKKQPSPKSKEDK
jgi:hypothetical protein